MAHGEDETAAGAAPSPAFQRELAPSPDAGRIEGLR
jgi:hypothetical protein